MPIDFQAILNTSSFMPAKYILKYLFALFLLTTPMLWGQTVDSTSFKINSRLSFYTWENSGEFLLQIPNTVLQKNITVAINIEDEIITQWTGKATGNIQRIPFSFDRSPSVYQVEASVTTGQGMSYLATTQLVVLDYKLNEVKTDRLTGGLIVNRRQFFPFGFYCYSPVYPSLPEEEVVRGFNMISPYQKILPETLPERKAYMDRCAELGMKVHYNLLSVSGGGGVGSKIDGLSDSAKKARLIEEIKTFRDHPALLAWYISDEPNGHKLDPELLKELYNTVKENDPWHPVTIVFTAPVMDSRKYSDALDIVMADPYPVPDLPVSLVGDVTSQLSAEFHGRIPVWIVPQVFGGGEIWGREPTIQEMRSMTWQSIIKGATGIQYFVRQGLNYFPKSTATWSECGRMAMEVAELTPWLLSDEETLKVQSYSADILVSSRVHDGQLLVMAVSRINKPIALTIRIFGKTYGNARVLFENRLVGVNGGLITDQIAPLGSQMYLINLMPDKPVPVTHILNLIKDPGFEDISSPGIPSACYARPGGDRGATYFLDTREHMEGNHSLRLVTPKDNYGVKLRFFPVSVTNGRTYLISVWAKTDPEQRPFEDTGKKTPAYFEISFGEFGTKRFNPGSAWQQFVTFVTIPYENVIPQKTNILLQMPSAGVAWFDLLQVTEGIDIKRCINPELRGNWDEFR